MGRVSADPVPVYSKSGTIRAESVPVCPKSIPVYSQPEWFHPLSQCSTDWNTWGTGSVAWPADGVASERAAVVPLPATTPAADTGKIRRRRVGASANWVPWCEAARRAAYWDLRPAFGAHELVVLASEHEFPVQRGSWCTAIQCAAAGWCPEFPESTTGE